MAMERRRVWYSGRVQGVGFRMSGERLARNFAVLGFIRNLDDGRVELVVEGEAAVIDAFLEAIRGSLGRFIRDERAESGPPGDSPFDGFSIRY